MAKKKRSKKKLDKKIKKLHKELYDSSKYVSRGEFIVAKMSKSLKRYYNSISEVRQKALVQYIIRQEDWEITNSLERHSKKSDNNEDEVYIKPRKCNTMAEVREDLARRKRKTKKQKKKRSSKNRVKRLVKGTDGLLHLLNPETYDQIKLDDKAYRKQLKKMIETEKAKEPIELDCTLKNFHKELMKNSSVNEGVMDSFWTKFEI